ncbi:MAG: RluA family pseudouridine synthase [Elusimicrobia bacterium]|nr:RluA family pseudouridine synthase [Elusimicrobiota bacterium]
MSDVPVLYEDERVLLVDKPAGRLVIPGRGAGEPPALVEELSARLGRKLFVVHRLDRETSGALAFAKDAPAHRELSGLFAAHRVAKAYLAAVQGSWDRRRVLEQPLGTFGSGRCGVRADGKPSRTDAAPVELFGGRASLVQVEPKTGRRHQVRVHLFAAGHPILGDPLYGKPEEWSRRAPRLMLHAWRLEFSLAGKRLRVQAPLPADFESFLSELRSGK